MVTFNNVFRNIIRPYTGMFWHVTWFIQAYVRNRFPPYSLEKDADSFRSL